MTNSPMDPRDGDGHSDDVRTRPIHDAPVGRSGYDATTAPSGYDVPADRAYGANGERPFGVDRGAYGTEPIIERQPAYLLAPRNGVGTAALVLGILGVLSAVVFIGGVLGLIAVILGFVGLGRVNRREATNRGSAMAGVVLGLIALAISIGVGALAYSNRDTLSNLGDCLQKAGSVAADQAACNEQFQDAVTR